MRLRAALKSAVRDCLREELGLPAGGCDVTPPPGRPFPSVGDFFVAICDGPQSARHSLSVDSYYTFQVVVSGKLGMVPADRAGTGFLDRVASNTIADGLNERIEAIAAVIFAKQWPIANEATTRMGGGAIVNGVLEATKPTNIGMPEEVGWDWFGAQPPDGQGKSQRAVAGYRAVASFVTRLMQTIDGGTF